MQFEALTGILRAMSSARRLPDLSALDADALRTLLLAHHEHLLSRDHEIEHLKLVIAKLRRMMFGAKSERVVVEIEQLELQSEELEVARAERTIAADGLTAAPSPTRPARGPLPEHLPREVHTHMPAEEACPECGGQLRKLGEDISEMLEYIPSSFKVLRHVRRAHREALCD